MYQMTIFDIQRNELEQTSEETMAQIIGEELGLHFRYNNYLKVYETNVQGYTISVHYSRYSTLDDRQGKRFIAVSIMNRLGGTSSPTDSFIEAIGFLRAGMKNRNLRVLE